jgi:hypothetical protein
MNKEILLGDKQNRRARRLKAVEDEARKTKKKRNVFMKSINEFDALLSNQATSNSETRNFARNSDLFHLCRRRWLLSELKNDPKM